MALETVERRLLREINAEMYFHYCLSGGAVMEF
jgi:hypothetical protein